MVHYDTVFGPGTAAKRPFRLDSERLWPGVADAKGGVAMILHALQLLQNEQFKAFGTLTVLFKRTRRPAPAARKKSSPNSLASMTTCFRTSRLTRMPSLLPPTASMA